MKDITQMTKEELSIYIKNKMEENKNNEEIELTPQQQTALWEAKTKMMQRNSMKNMNNKQG